MKLRSHPYQLSTSTAIGIAVGLLVLDVFIFIVRCWSGG